MMRAKYAREIRAGINRANYDIAFTMLVGGPPMAPLNLHTKLAHKAWRLTIGKFIMKELKEMEKRMLERYKLIKEKPNE